MIHLNFLHKSFVNLNKRPLLEKFPQQTVNLHEASVSSLRVTCPDSKAYPLSLLFPLICTTRTDANWINLHEECNRKKKRNIL